ncbi:MAG TPA: hypothetical protein VFG77_02430, partial [Nitrososphaeraceae archaeon]|nr:hypothetical protein [Nitrososphaeraceae archaeon]
DLLLYDMNSGNTVVLNYVCVIIKRRTIEAKPDGNRQTLIFYCRMVSDFYQLICIKLNLGFVYYRIRGIVGEI